METHPTITYTALVDDAEAATEAGFIVIDEDTVEVRQDSDLMVEIEYDLEDAGIYEIPGVIVIEAP